MNDGMHQGQRSLWDILGTEPTGDERAIKRAYAKQLKTTRPDDDPAAFQQLREAYEYALRHAPMLNAQLLEHERGPQRQQHRPNCGEWSLRKRRPRRYRHLYANYGARSSSIRPNKLPACGMNS
jgi:hypothetical protein